MGRHNFFYFAREGAYNMFSHGFMSFAAIGITVACLLIMGTFTLVAVNANAMLAELESQNQVLAFVELGMTEVEARAVEKDILAVDNVAGATFISDKEAAAAFRGRYEDDELFQGLPDENFPHRFAIDLKDIGRMSQTKADLEALPGIGPGGGAQHREGQRLRGRGRRVHHHPQRGGHRVRGAHCGAVSGVRVHHRQHHQAHHL